MIYWDTSALVPVFVIEKETEKVREWLKEFDDAPRFTSWLTVFEFETTLKRKINQKLLSVNEYDSIQERWMEFCASLNFIPLDSRVTRMGSQIQRLHGLRPYESIQLGSASLVKLDHPELKLACLDEKLVRVSKQEGFPCLT